MIRNRTLKQSFIEIVCAAFLVGINLIWMRPFLNQEPNFGSCGAPFVPLVVNALEFLFKLPVNTGFLITFWFSFLFGTLSLYFLVKEVVGRRLTGLMAGFFYSLPIGILALSRVKLALMLGDGAHVISFSFFPLVCFAVLRFLKTGDLSASIWASLGITLVALTSPFGLFNLMIFLTVITFSEMLLNQGRLKFIRGMLVVLQACGFVAFWYNPRFILSVFAGSRGRQMLSVFSNMLPISIVILPIVGTFCFLLFEKKVKLQPTFLSLGLLVLYLIFNFAETTGRHLLDVPSSRFLPELSLSLTFFIAIVSTFFLDWLQTKPRINKLILPYKANKGVSLAFLITTWILVFIMVWCVFPIGDFLSEFEGRSVFGLEVVGLFLGVERESSLFSDVLGYVITFITVVVVMLMRRKIKQLKHAGNRVRYIERKNKEDRRIGD